MLIIKGTGFILNCDLEGRAARLIDSFWYPEFGVAIANKMLEIDFEESHMNIEF